MDMDRVRLVLEDGAERVKRDPGYAIKLAAGVVLCLTGFILFLVEAKRSDGVQGSNYVIGFPLKDESHAQSKGMHFPAATICPAVSLDVAGSTGLGQITNLQCVAAGYAPLPVPPVSVQSVIVKKTDFTTDTLANYACWTVNADLKLMALSSSHTIKCDGFFANLDGLPEAEAAVTYFDPRSESLDRAPSVDQFLWHSLHLTALTSMYIEPKELVFLNGKIDWLHEPHFGQHFKYNITDVKASGGLKPGVSLSYGYRFLMFKQIREVNLYTSNQFWGVCGGLLYLLVGLYSLVLAAMSAYGLDADAGGAGGGLMGYGGGGGGGGGEYKTVEQAGGGIAMSSDVGYGGGGNPYEPSRAGVEPSVQPGTSGGGGGYGTL